MSGIFEQLAAEVKAKHPGATVKESHHLGARSGRHVYLPNGYTVSVQYGGYTYSTNRNRGIEDIPVGGWITAAYTAEVAYWYKDGDFVRFEDGDSVGADYNFEDVLALIDRVAALTSEVA